MFLYDLVLYYDPSCPHCEAVLHFMKKEGIELEMRDVTNPAYAAELLEKTGTQAVPCLMVHGEPVFGDTKIIDNLGQIDYHEGWPM